MSDLQLPRADARACDERRDHALQLQNITAAVGTVRKANPRAAFGPLSTARVNWALPPDQAFAAIANARRIAQAPRQA